MARHSPSGRSPPDPEQVAPLFRVREVVAIGVFGVDALEIEFGGDLDEPLVVGEALELDAHGAADIAPPAVGAHQIAGLKRLRAVGGVDRDPQVVIPMLDAGEGVGIEGVEAGFPGKRLGDVPGQLVLFVLEDEGKAKLVLQQCQIERGHPFATGPVVVLERRCLQAPGDDVPGDAQVVQHFQGRRMDRRRPRIDHRFGVFLHHADADPALEQSQGAGHPHRPGADHDDVEFPLHGAYPTICQT